MQGDPDKWSQTAIITDHVTLCIPPLAPYMSSNIEAPAVCNYCLFMIPIHVTVYLNSELTVTSTLINYIYFL